MATSACDLIFITSFQKIKKKSNIVKFNQFLQRTYARIGASHTYVSSSLEVSKTTWNIQSTASAPHWGSP